MKQIVITPALMELAMGANPAQKAMLWSWLDALSKDKEWKPEFGEAENLDDVQLYQGLREALKLKKMPAKDFSLQVSEVIAHLNKVTKSRFSPTTKAYKSLISQLIAQGYAAEDLKHVVDLQHQKWQGTEYEQYLTPTTLFGNKFQNYYNALAKQPTNNHPQDTKGSTTNRINSIRSTVEQTHQRIDELFSRSGNGG